MTTPGLADSISGVILCDETIRQHQQPALTIWDGQAVNVTRAQHALRQRRTANQAARRGEYTPSE